MGNLHPTVRRHGEAYRDALYRSRKVIARLRRELLVAKRMAKLAQKSRAMWKRRAINSGGIRL